MSHRLAASLVELSRTRNSNALALSHRAFNRRRRRPYRTAAPQFASWPVSRVLYGGVATARRPFILDARCRTPHATYPDDWPENQPGAEAPRHPYSVLLPVGFTMPAPLPGPRWALTPPFHPYPPGRSRRGGLLSAALSLGSPPPGVIRHRVSMEPGLSSPAAFRPLPERPSGQLTIN